MNFWKAVQNCQKHIKLLRNSRKAYKSFKAILLNLPKFIENF